jgi:hypothetical protein
MRFGSNCLLCRAGARAVLCTLLLLFEAPPHVLFASTNVDKSQPHAASEPDGIRVQLWDGATMQPHTIKEGVGGGLPMMLVKCESRSLIAATVG